MDRKVDVIGAIYRNIAEVQQILDRYEAKYSNGIKDSQDSLASSKVIIEAANLHGKLVQLSSLSKALKTNTHKWGTLEWKQIQEYIIELESNIDISVSRMNAGLNTDINDTKKSNKANSADAKNPAAD